jgi:hypothetical protein
VADAQIRENVQSSQGKNEIPGLAGEMHLHRFYVKKMLLLKDESPPTGCPLGGPCLHRNQQTGGVVYITASTMTQRAQALCPIVGMRNFNCTGLPSDECCHEE